MKIKRLSRFRTAAILAGAVATLALAGHGLSRAADAQGYVRLHGTAAIPADRLRAAIDPLFDPAAAPSIGETRALIVMRDGKVIAERYAPGFGPGSRMLSWSVAKTVNGLLVGVMVGDGRLALDDPAPVAAWRQPGDPRAAITLRHLMQMRSGLSHVELGEPREKADSLRMLVGPGAGDQAGYAAAKPLVETPGTRFTYSSGNSVLLSGIMADRLTASRVPDARREAMAQFMAARLTGPLGLSSLIAEYDASGTMLGGAMMHMTARDYARIGELLRNRGRAGGKQIVPERWIDFMTTPSPANPAYGGQLWINRAGKPSDLFPGLAPPSIYGAVGYRGQFVIVSPQQRLTIVRLGVTNEADMTALRHALARLVQAMPR